MGYTHYWYIPQTIPLAQFQQLVRGVQKIIAASTIPLAGGDGTGNYIINDDKIVFNGKSPNEYESFYIDRDTSDIVTVHRTKPKLSFSFCKTGRYPYDRVVVAVLVWLKQILGDECIISSDGGRTVFLNGITDVRNAGLEVRPNLYDEIKNDPE